MTDAKVPCRICKKKFQLSAEDLKFDPDRDYCEDCKGSQDWKTKCGNCGSKPTVVATGLCGPCTFGEVETAGGNW